MTGSLAARAAACVLLLTAPAVAQELGLGSKSPVKRDSPVTFEANDVFNDRDRNLVVATGNVEAWQDNRVLRADMITFDRTTGVAAAKGHVQVLEPDGQVLYADYAELTQGFKDGVLSGMSARLADNGRLTATGGRRTNGIINEFSQLTYTTCDLCKDDPTAPPLWAIRAHSAVQDNEKHRIEYYDGDLQFYGHTVAYIPYFFHADPSVKRASGLLVPSFGESTRLGGFFTQPYYAVLDDQSDLIVAPTITSKAGAALDLNYRRRFNDGQFSINGSIAQTPNDSVGGGGVQGAISSKGRFDIDETWRYGFDIDRASSQQYVRDFRLSKSFGTDASILSSTAYLEGFGDGSYTRLDTRFYQSLTTTLSDTRTPVSLPRYTYSYAGLPDALGGRVSFEAGAFNVFRAVGTNTRRANVSPTYDLPFDGAIGDRWTASLHADVAAYDYDRLGQSPNFGDPAGSGGTVRALPQAGITGQWPLARATNDWGTQVVTPVVQFIAAPNAGGSQFRRIPNEDSFALEFTDTALFGWNRYPGIDRLEGGFRANAALRGAWYFNGTVLDAQFGQGYISEVDRATPPRSGLNRHRTDYVGHVSYSPSPWLDLTYKGRFDGSNLAGRYSEFVGTAGTSALSVNAAYLRTSTDPYYLYETTPPPAGTSAYYFPRDEVSFGIQGRRGYYRGGGYVRRDLARNQFSSIGVQGAYEDECYVLSLQFFKRYTSIAGDSGSTTFLVQMTFKTVGSVGFNAL